MPQSSLSSRSIACILALIFLILGALARYIPRLTEFVAYWHLEPGRMRLYFVFYTLVAVTTCGAFALSAENRSRLLNLPDRRIFLATGLLLSVASAWFVIHFGRIQFGAYDFDIANDLGWRASLGQVPMRDFVTYMPPGFIFGLKYAFRLVGPYWNANLYAAAALTFVSFWWMLWLLRQVDVPRGLAQLLALSVEAAAMLSTCFWWYNNTATIMAAVFFLGCIACAHSARRLSVEISLAVSLGLLLLLKPNVAGLTIILGLVPLLALGESRRRLLLATVAGFALAALILFAEGMNPFALMAAYRAIAADRGGLSLFGFLELGIVERVATVLLVALLILPLFFLLPIMLRAVRQRDKAKVREGMLLWGTPVVAVYSVMTNGDWHDVELTVLILAFGLALLWGPLWRRKLIVAVAIGILIGNLGANIAYGARRLRVYTVGQHYFFDWPPLEHVSTGFFRDMDVSPTLVKVNEEIRRAIASVPGPVFFGPRLMTQYAVIREPSPTGIALFWQPGTSFPQSRTVEMLEAWRAHRFPMLIFLKDDYSYYTPEFLRILATDYIRDDRFPDLTVYHRRPFVS